MRGIKGAVEGGDLVTEHARVVVGADGRYSMVAEAVAPEHYHEKPRLLAIYYSYWSDLPTNGLFETYIRPKRGFAVVPDARRPDDGHRRVAVRGIRRQQAGTWRATTSRCSICRRRSPSACARPGASSRFAGAAVPNFFRKPYGPGWALVGDAGYNKDPITRQGSTTPSATPSLCAGARRDASAARASTRPWRTTSAPRRRTCCRCSSSPAARVAGAPPPEMQQLLGAIDGNQAAMDGFARERRHPVASGVLSRRRTSTPSWPAAAARRRSVGAASV